jgi:hypothetical protein
MALEAAGVRFGARGAVTPPSAGIVELEEK